MSIGSSLVCLKKFWTSLKWMCFASSSNSKIIDSLVETTAPACLIRYIYTFLRNNSKLYGDSTYFECCYSIELSLAANAIGSQIDVIISFYEAYYFDVGAQYITK
jgi:hypothetical protein